MKLSTLLDMVRTKFLMHRITVSHPLSGCRTKLKKALSHVKKNFFFKVFLQGHFLMTRWCNF